MRSNKKRLIPLALALVLAMVGAALAVPQISVTIQNLGQGSKTITSTVNAASVDFTVSSDGTQITGVKVKVVDQNDNPVTSGTVYVQLLDSGNNVVASGSGSPDSNGIVTITFSSPVDIQANTGAYSVAVTYQGSSVTG
ncbi:hypothetical protein [Thermococcus sp.]|uniref:hypothetical protein n=1 Tax=Thermococcus sp. TaxID=35749 RepID=UPI0026339211|nr:hypothetical protein [Thermococcus sp.]